MMERCYHFWRYRPFTWDGKKYCWPCSVHVFNKQHWQVDVDLGSQESNDSK